MTAHRFVFLILFFIGLAPNAQASDFDLAQLLRPLTFPLLKRQSSTGLLQVRLQDVTAQIRTECANFVAPLTPEREWLCQWPRIVEEFDTAASFISRSSPDQQKLVSTLAAGLHPFEIDLDQTSFDYRFDVIAPRYLIALRLMRDVWPSVQDHLRHRQSSSPLDLSMEPWLTSETSWSFAWRSYKSIRCRDLEPACDQRNQLARYLRATLPLISDDSNLERISQLDPAMPLRLTKLSENPGSLHAELGYLDPFMDALMTGVFANAANGYLFLLQDPSDTANNTRQIREYLNHVKADASRPTRNAMRASGDVCRDIPLLAQFSQADKMPWASSTRDFPSDCPTLRRRSPLVDVLDRDGMRYRFYLFHLRTVIAEFYAPNKNLDPILLAQGRNERRLVDILKVIREIRQLRSPFIEPKDEPQRLKWTRPLLEELYELVDQLETK